MAKSRGDDKQLQRACEAAIEGTKQKVVMSIRVAKSQGAWGKGKIGSKGSQVAKPRVLAISTHDKGGRTKVFLHVLKYTNGEELEPAKIYKLKRLAKVEVLTNDASGCTFMLGFDNIRNQRVAPIQWTMRNLDDRNRLLVCILHTCKDALGHLPKVVGVDIVELALWAKEHASEGSKQQNLKDGSADVLSEVNSAVENDLVSQAEEEDMEALLGTYVMGIGEAELFSERLKRELHALEAANVHAILETEHLVDEVLHGLESSIICAEDMDEWLALFNVKLRHMREDIEAIETRNNKLERQSINYKALVVELENLLEKLHIPHEISDSLAGDSFDNSSIDKYIEACDWLRDALRGFDALDPSYAKTKAVKEKRAELDINKLTFVRKAGDFLRDHFVQSVDILMNDKRNFSQRGQLKKPDHADLHNKCRVYVRLLHHLKILDSNCLAPLRKAYCSSLNQVLRREARDFANELRAGTKAPKVQSVWFEGPSPNQNVDTSMISEAYSKMVAVFIPLLVDESSFLAFLMRFEVSSDDELDMEADENGSKGTLEMGALNESLRDLLEGIQEDFYATVDWAHKIDPLLCISMHGVTEKYLTDIKAETAGYVRLLLDALEDRITTLFTRFVEDARHQIEKNDKNVKQTGVMSFVPRFALLATRMEQYIQGQSRDLVDQAYIKIIGIMFVTLDKIAQADPKHSDIFLLENYAAFQNSLYELANCVPTLAKFYHQASESYEQSCSRHISVIIYYQFERLFQFARRIEDLMLTNAPEEIQFQVGMSKSDLRKVVKSSLTGVDKHITAMHKKLMKNLTSEELLPTLWDKCKKEFLDKYDSFAQLASKVYPNENIPSVPEIRDLLASM